MRGQSCQEPPVKFKQLYYKLIYNPQYVTVSKIPTIIKMAPAIFCTTDPNLRPFFNNAPFSPMYEMTTAKIISGMEVPMAKTDGRTAPYDVFSTIGISVKKYRENIVGQNAIEKLTPIKKDPVFPLPVHCGKTDVKRLIQLNAKTPISDRPIRMNRGPISLRNQEKKPGKICWKLCPTSQTARPSNV